MTNDLTDAPLILFKDILYPIRNGLFLNNYVLNTNCKSAKDQPIVHNLLRTAEEFRTSLFVKVFDYYMIKTLASCTNDAFIKRTTQKFALIN